MDNIQFQLQFVKAEIYTTKEQINFYSNLLKNTEEKLEKLQQTLEFLNYKSSCCKDLKDAEVGQYLEDGSMVLDIDKDCDIKRYFIAAPKRTEIQCSWNNCQQRIHEKLKEKLFDPDEWKIPDEDELKKFFIISQFQPNSGFVYWTNKSDDVDFAYCITMNSNNIYDYEPVLRRRSKNKPYRVRAVRWIYIQN